LSPETEEKESQKVRVVVSVKEISCTVCAQAIEKQVKKMKGIVSILIASFAIRMLLMFVNSFQSDESIYVYAGYAISKGLIPYREILLAHPPLIFLIYSAIIWLSGASLTLIRLFNVGLFTITIFQTYIFSKMLLENWNKLWLVRRT
jgi:copper chaperone CopZ